MIGFLPATNLQLDTGLLQKSRRGRWAIAIAALIVVTGALALTSSQLVVNAAICTGGCTPNQAPPLLGPHIYTSSAFGYSLEYSDSTGVTLVKTIENDRSIGWQVKDNPFYAWVISGANASGRGPQQIVEAAKSADFPGASLVYTIPQAEIGYTLGYGNVYDDHVTPGAGENVHVRIFIMASIKNGVAVTMEGMGLYKQIQYGHPNPSLSPAPELFDPILNTVIWKGEPPL